MKMCCTACSQMRWPGTHFTSKDECNIILHAHSDIRLRLSETARHSCTSFLHELGLPIAHIHVRNYQQGWIARKHLKMGLQYTGRSLSWWILGGWPADSNFAFDTGPPSSADSHFAGVDYCGYWYLPWQSCILEQFKSTNRFTVNSTSLLAWWDGSASSAQIYRVSLSEKSCRVAVTLAGLWRARWHDQLQSYISETMCGFGSDSS